MGIDTVPPIDLAELSPSDFMDDELDMPYYLSHFHRVANSVVMDGENRGFIDITVWRRDRDNRPYNARIMENCLALAYFYCTDRPWNTYRGLPAVRERLEAALDFWCRMQNGDGRFSEYGPGKWNLAATAFATKFMGEGLSLLRDGPEIDGGIHRRAVEADRRAIHAVLTMDELYEHGKGFSNQFANVWGGALAYLDLCPDPELKSLLEGRLEQSLDDLQSPAGYFYERHGPDWGYFCSTHHSDLRIAWHYAKSTDLSRLFIEKQRRWYDWFAYNAVREPDGSGFLLNRAIETRQQRSFLAEFRTALGGVTSRGSGQMQNAPAAEVLELPRAFCRTREEHLGDIAAARHELTAGWPQIPGLRVGEFFTFSPYAFLHRRHPEWYPSDAEKAGALKSLPYLARERFLHQRVDSRHPLVFTFVRRPAYYAVFNAGPVLGKQPRHGLGLLWHPRAGGLLQSQTGTDDAAWGTTPDGASSPYEAEPLTAGYSVSGVRVEPSSGNRDLPDGVLSISYALGGAGSKTVAFADEAVEVSVDHPGGFLETLPLLKGDSDALEVSGATATLTRGDFALAISSWGQAELDLVATQRRVGSREVVVLRIRACDRLEYRVEMV